MEKKLPERLTEEVAAFAVPRPLRLMFQDEVRSGRISDVRHVPCRHTSQTMKLAENMRILFLPPYSPELNPQEHAWDELREKFFHNRAFDSHDAFEIHLESALKSFELNQETMRSIVGWD